MTNSRQLVRLTAAAISFLALASCGSFDSDFRRFGGGLNTTDAALNATAPRPAPDARGLIIYPSYQVAIARRGDTVTDVATRLGVPAGELAAFNGVRDGVPLRDGETLVLPTAAAPDSGLSGGVDVAAVAGNAIERADGVQTTTLGTGTTGGIEPRQHRVEPGETAFSIARLYGVTPTALAEWNGLGPELDLRPGEILLIPIVLEPGPTAAASPVTTTLPGVGSVAPEPPSASEPLPQEEQVAAVAPVAAPEPPKVAEEQSDDTRLLMPVQGKIIRAFDGNESKGIDIAAPEGSDVRAADDGTVAAISPDTNGVLAVVVRHDDELLTVYFGVKEETVSKDESVKRGQVLGKVRDGDPSFLHFEVRQGFDPLDPMTFLN